MQICVWVGGGGAFADVVVATESTESENQHYAGRAVPCLGKEHIADWSFFGGNVSPVPVRYDVVVPFTTHNP